MRLNSFSLASEELFVTPGAVGQQIRKLEEWLGVTLFIRQIRQIQPTPDGLTYWARIQPALTQILQASRALRDSHSAGVWLTMPPSLAAKWFARRMTGFVTAHPAVTLHLSSSTELVDFEREQVDLAIRYFDGEDPELRSELLYRDEARVYCTPSYAEQHRLQRPEDLICATLVHNTLHPHWKEWLLRHAGLDEAEISAIPGIHFDQSLMAIETAKQGQGVVLTSTLLTEEEITNGTLIEPFKEGLPLPKGYYVVHHRMTALRPAAQAVQDWLIKEAANAT